MLRSGCSFLRWAALAGLLASGAARADVPGVTPLPPVTAATGFVDSGVVQASYNEPFETSAPTTVPDVQSTSGDPTPPLACNPADGMGECRRRVWTPFAGIETVFLAPVHNTGGGGASYSFSEGSNSANYQASSANGMVATPRIWLGLMGDRWGVGVRYWSFGNDPGYEQFPSGTSQGVYRQGVLRMQTFDLEAIRRFQFADQQLWFTVGTRQAQFSRQSTVSSADYFSQGVYSATASSGASFDGVGVTASINGLRPIGLSHWNLFYSLRASYLFAGSSSAFAQTSAAYNSNTSGAGANYPSAAIGNGDAFIGEVQLGLQYNHALAAAPASVFFRIACEYQYWHVNNDASAFANASASAPGGSLVSSTASAGNSNVGLLGFGIATGITW